MYSSKNSTPIGSKSSNHHRNWYNYIFWKSLYFCVFKQNSNLIGYILIRTARGGDLKLFLALILWQLSSLSIALFNLSIYIMEYLLVTLFVHIDTQFLFTKENPILQIGMLQTIIYEILKTIAIVCLASNLLLEIWIKNP